MIRIGLRRAVLWPVKVVRAVVGSFRFDSTTVTFDSTTFTFDEN